MKIIKRFIKKFTEIPVIMTAAALATISTIFLLVSNGNASPAGIGALLTLITLVGLQFHYGSVVVKRVISIFTIVYLSAFYTYIVTNTSGEITQPFLLTIAAVTGFSAFTYDKSYLYGLRSRKLWATVLAILLVTVKLTIITVGFGFWIAEFIGLNFVIIYTLLWRMWAKSSKKTKVNPPKINREEKDDKYKYIYIDGKFNSKTNSWVGEFKNGNAYPYIYSEVMKAREENLTLVLISETSNEEIYDKGEIVINKAKHIPYIYMEDKDKLNFKEIMEDFENEINKETKIV